LRTEYVSGEFIPYPEDDGLFRYRDWLPVARTYANVGKTVVFRSGGLGDSLGLPNLWIAFSGYWPERGASLETATFKEFVAYTALARMPERHGMLTVASSGNTGAAFAWACSQVEAPCLVIVPEKGLHRLNFLGPLHRCVNLVVIEDGDYPDAIDLAASVCQTFSLQAEGGVKNVARRDALGTVLLSAFEAMGRLPSHYFQAVGSGTGALGVLEAADRVRLATGNESLPRLMLCQNAPFAPMHDAWRKSRRSLIDRPTEELRAAISQVRADELANWSPPYAVAGGVYDALVNSGGDFMVADSESVQTAMKMFAELEGIDIEPAVGVAVACLRDAVAQERIGKASVVLLNVSGGGRGRLAAERSLNAAIPRLRIARESLSREETVYRIGEICAAAPSPV
jgi:cysteate synthase